MPPPNPTPPEKKIIKATILLAVLVRNKSRSFDTILPINRIFLISLLHCVNELLNITNDYWPGHWSLIISCYDIKLDSVYIYIVWLNKLYNT